MRTCSRLSRLGRRPQWSGLAVRGQTRACPCSLGGTRSEGTARPACCDYRQIKAAAVHLGLLPCGARLNIRLHWGISGEDPQAPGWGPDTHRLRRCQRSGPSWPMCPPRWPAPIAHVTQQTVPEPYIHGYDGRLDAADARPSVWAPPSPAASPAVTRGSVAEPVRKAWAGRGAGAPGPHSEWPANTGRHHGKGGAKGLLPVSILIHSCIRQRTQWGRWAHWKGHCCPLPTAKGPGRSRVGMLWAGLVVGLETLGSPTADSPWGTPGSGHESRALDRPNVSPVSGKVLSPDPSVPGGEPFLGGKDEWRLGRLAGCLAEPCQGR